MVNLEIIVNSCDAYEDVWLPFFYSLRENWNGVAPPVVLNTETKSFSLEGLSIRRPPIVINSASSKDDWGRRLLAALDCIVADYVLMAFDDHIVEKQIDCEEISRCVCRLERERDICAFYLINPFLPLLEAPEDSRFAEVSPHADYILNSAPAVWRKADLMRFIRPGDNPWGWEYFGSVRLHAARKRVFAPREGSSPIYSYQHALGGAIYRGKWVAPVIEPVLERYGLSLDLSLRGTIEPRSLPHSLGWKLRFLHAGVKMVGLSALLLVGRAFIRKLMRKVVG